MTEKSDPLKEARKRIHDRIQLSEMAKKVELQRHRLVLAGRGAHALQEKHLGDAAQAFKGYLKVMEDLKGVPSGGLSPQHFDIKTEIPELMLIAGVYWDLLKLYDRTRSPEKYTEFKGYLSKYIQFARGLPFQRMCAQTMRKYIRASRPLHSKEFQESYKLIAGPKCFIATALTGYTSEETLPALRVFRDEVLKKHSAGRSFVAWYYRNGPRLAEKVETLPEPVKHVFGKILDRVARAASAVTSHSASGGSSTDSRQNPPKATSK